MIDPHVAITLRLQTERTLEALGVDQPTRDWIRNEDFLEARPRTRFTHIVGNPPYIRWDAIPVLLRETYRARFASFKQRADLYVAFIEHALSLLDQHGQLGFLCPGTWTRNVYGSAVREAFTSLGRLKTIIDFSDVVSFETPADAFVLGARAYIGDAYCPPQFRLVVAGQDAGTLHRILKAVPTDAEYAVHRERIEFLLSALPWTPKELGAMSTALGLDVDRRRGAVPFMGQNFLLLDGYGKLSAGPGSQFYVLDPVSHQLAPREARAIEIGDAVFVMPDSIREEIEAALREKDDKGRSLEQSLVDQYIKSW